MKASQKTDEIQSSKLTSVKKFTFKPLRYLKNRHLQTILPNFIHPAIPTLEKQRVELDDGDSIDLLWNNVRGPQTLLILPAQDDPFMTVEVLLQEDELSGPVTL